MDFSHPHKIEIIQILEANFHPEYLEVVDESYMHASGAKAGSHYKVILVSDVFTGLPLLKRSRLVHEYLENILAEKIHALSLKLYSPAEWLKSPNVPESPKCAGQNKH